MKQASVEYRQAMQEPWRGQWQLNLSVGLIREVFQATAISETLSMINYLSENYDNHLFDDTKTVGTVASFEQNTFKADGSPIFMDKSHTGVGLDYYGYISEDLSDENSLIDVTIKFKSKVGESGLRGLTLYFDQEYPSEFTIICNDEGSEVFRKDYTNESLTFITTDVFSDVADEMMLHVTKMNKPHVRFRLRYVLFGVGLRFSNSEVLSAGGTLKTFMHPCSVEQPTQDINVTINNYDGDFDFERPGSFTNLIAQGQDISFQMGYTHEDGTVEALEPTVLEISSFSVDPSSLKISGVDFLRNENNKVIFDDPAFFTSSTTLYDVAEKVLESLSNLSFNVVIDVSLKEIPMKFNSIDTTVRDALMMISSAARCVMDLRGKSLYIRRTDYSFGNLTITSDDKTSNSDMDLFTFTPAVNLATFEPNRVPAGGDFIFPSDTVSPDYKTGFISEELSNEDGTFTNPPTLIITSEEAISPSYLSMNFKHTHPVSVSVVTYYNSDIIETFKYSVIDEDLRVLYDFKEFNKMEITINKIREPHSRLYISTVSYERLPYFISSVLYEQKEPTGKSLDQVRNIIVTYTTATKNEDTIEQTQKTVSIQCNEKGSDIEYDNPFITTEEVARETGLWLKKFYQTQVQYDVKYMGDPTIESYDVVRLENEYRDDLLCDVMDCETSFTNGGIRGKITARRIENGVD